MNNRDIREDESERQSRENARLAKMLADEITEVMQYLPPRDKVALIDDIAYATTLHLVEAKREREQTEKYWELVKKWEKGGG